MLEGVTIEQLRALRAVAEAGSFSAAARKLGRVQAAVSQSMDRLEAQLGLRLFDRSGRVARLTEHGHAVVAAAARVGGEIDGLDELVAELKRGAETRLTIAVDAMFPIASLVELAKAFAREHPSVELVLVADVMSSVTALVRERRATLGVAVEDADLRELNRRTIARVELVPVAAPSHPLAARPELLDASALGGAVQIVLSEQRRGAAASEDHGVFSPRTWRVADLATKHALVAGGLGWGHLPEHVVREDLAARRLVRLRLAAWGGEGVSRDLVLVRRRAARLGPVARWAEEQLESLCRREVHHAP
jgi:DNA-binding transcriptional LysR family regulator